MLLELIVFGTFMIAAFWSGFYFGHLKREGRPPERFPIVGKIKQKIHEARTKEEPPVGFYN
jgi:hypothetical protein